MHAVLTMLARHAPGTHTSKSYTSLASSEDQISARYDNGELEVHVKKPEIEMPHRIRIGNGKAAIEGKTTRA